jgi:hypothetical protein
MCKNFYKLSIYILLRGPLNRRAGKKCMKNKQNETPVHKRRNIGSFRMEEDE